MKTAPKLFEKKHRQHSKLFTAAMVATGAVVTGVVAAAAMQQVERRRLQMRFETDRSEVADDLARLEGEGGPPAPVVMPAQRAKS